MSGTKGPLTRRTKAVKANKLCVDQRTRMNDTHTFPSEVRQIANYVKFSLDMNWSCDLERHIYGCIMCFCDICKFKYKVKHYEYDCYCLLLFYLFIYFYIFKFCTILVVMEPQLLTTQDFSSSTQSFFLSFLFKMFHSK